MSLVEKMVDVSLCATCSLPLHRMANLPGRSCHSFSRQAQAQQLGQCRESNEGTSDERSVTGQPPDAGYERI